MKTNRTILFAAAALFAVTAVSCNKEENGNNGEETVYTLELADPLDKEIILNDDQAEAFDVELNTNIDADQLSVESKEEQDWCAASLATDGKSVKVTPGSNFTENDLTATFVISTTVEGVTPVEFTVIRRGTSTQYTVSIEADGLIKNEYMDNGFDYSVDATSPEALTITVNTNAAMWYFGDSNNVTDDNYEPIEWYTVDRRSGRNGETITVTFTDNNTASIRNTMLYFDVEPIEGMMPFTETYVQVTVSQNPAPATSVTVSDDNGKLTTNHKLSLGKDRNALTFTIDADGGTNTIFVKPGTSESDPTFDGENDWIFAGAAIWDPTAYTLNVLENTTGAERSVDIVITPAGGTDELFRFKVTQAGA